MLLTSAGLTAASLFIVQRNVENQVRRNLRLDLANSVETFRNFQKEREESLTRSAELMADLPVLKALMTSRHAPTIQDASGELFRLSGGDLLALVDQSNQVVGFHTRTPGLTLEQAQSLRDRKTAVDSSQQWWFAGGHLYEVFLAPIYLVHNPPTRCWARSPSATRSTRTSRRNWRAWRPGRLQWFVPTRKSPAPLVPPKCRSCSRPSLTERSQ